MRHGWTTRVKKRRQKKEQNGTSNSRYETFCHRWNAKNTPIFCLGPHDRSFGSGSRLWTASGSLKTVRSGITNKATRFLWKLVASGSTQHWMLLKKKKSKLVKLFSFTNLWVYFMQEKVCLTETFLFLKAD